MESWRASGIANPVARQHRAHQTVEPLAVLRHRRLRLDLAPRQVQADLGQATFDAIIDRKRVRQYRAGTGRDLGIQRSGIGAGDHDAFEFGRATGIPMLTPQVGELHVRTELHLPII